MKIIVAEIDTKGYENYNKRPDYVFTFFIHFMGFEFVKLC